MITIQNTIRNIQLESDLQSTSIARINPTVTVANTAVIPDNPVVDSIQFDTTPENVPQAAGVLSYNETDRALEVQIGNEVILTINEELPIDLLNRLGSQLDNGKLVYISGAQGNRATAGLASNATCATASKTIGMLTENVANNQRGKATTIGRVKGLNTHGIAEGTELWLGVNGDYTTVKPSVGTPRVRIGWVLKEHVNDGWIFVFIQQEKYMFGDRDNGNYSVFEDDGTLMHYGDARTFKDMICDVLNLRQQGTGISYNVAENTVEITTGADLNDYLYANIQLNHDRDLTTPIYPHAHMFQTVSAHPNLLLEYRWQINGRAKTTAWTRLVLSQSAFTYVSGTLNQIYYSTAINPPANSGISDILQIRLYRDNANASGLFSGVDPVNAVIGLTSFDVHYASNKGGSHTEYTD